MVHPIHLIGSLDVSDTLWYTRYFDTHLKYLDTHNTPCYTWHLLGLDTLKDFSYKFDTRVINLLCFISTLNKFDIFDVHDMFDTPNVLHIHLVFFYLYIWLIKYTCKLDPYILDNDLLYWYALTIYCWYIWALSFI